MQSPGSEQQAELAYQQQLIEELLAENEALKQQLAASEGKLAKVEQQLTKTKMWIRELGNIKEDIVNLKHSAQDVQELDSLGTENEILRAKITELETKMNTLSRGEEEKLTQLTEHYELELSKINDDTHK